MSSVQDRFILAAAVVVESVWIYAAFSILGLMFSLGGSPLTWVASIVIMGFSFAVARTLSLVIMPVWMPYLVQMLSGVLVIYLTLASQVQSAGQGFDIGWIGALLSESKPEYYVRTVALASVFSLVFWWRGGKLAATEYPAEHLSFTFRVGLVVFSIGAVVDVFHSADLKMFPLMFAFFAAGLIGLSIGHILPTAGRTLTSQRWIRVIGVLVGAIMVVGFLFSLLQKGFLNFILAPFGVLLNAVGTVVLYIVIFPIVYIIEFLVRGLFWLLGRFSSEAERPELNTGPIMQEMLEQVQKETGDGTPLWVYILQWTSLTIIVLIALFILAKAFHQTMRWRRVDDDGEREGLDEDVDPALDMARLLYNLLPDRFRRRRGERGLRLPDDEQDVVDVFRVYFGMLKVAQGEGMPRRGEQTPTEYKPTLARLFPERFVDMATSAFERACYGRRPASKEDIDEMRNNLEQSRGRS